MDSREALCGQIYAPSFLKESAVENTDRFASEKQIDPNIDSNRTDTDRIN